MTIVNVGSKEHEKEEGYFETNTYEEEVMAMDRMIESGELSCKECPETEVNRGCCNKSSHNMKYCDRRCSTLMYTACFPFFPFILCHMWLSSCEGDEGYYKKSLNHHNKFCIREQSCKTLIDNDE